MSHTDADPTGLAARSEKGDFLLMYLFQFRDLTSLYLLIESANTVKSDMTSSRSNAITGQDAIFSPRLPVQY